MFFENVKCRFCIFLKKRRKRLFKQAKKVFFALQLRNNVKITRLNNGFLKFKIFFPCKTHVFRILLCPLHTLHGTSINGHPLVDNFKVINIYSSVAISYRIQ